MWKGGSNMWMFFEEVEKRMVYDNLPDLRYMKYSNLVESILAQDGDHGGVVSEPEASFRGSLDHADTLAPIKLYFPGVDISPLRGT